MCVGNMSCVSDVKCMNSVECVMSECTIPYTSDTYEYLKTENKTRTKTANWELE